jgi:hypothetical protein
MQARTQGTEAEYLDAPKMVLDLKFNKLTRIDELTRIDVIGRALIDGSPNFWIT